MTDPFNPKLTGSCRLGGITSRAPHPNGPAQRRRADGRGEPRRPRVYVTNSLYAAWDEQFYPEGLRGWFAKIEAIPQGGMRIDPKLFVHLRAASGRIRCASKAATLRPIRTAIRERSGRRLAVGRRRDARRVSRREPLDGLAVSRSRWACRIKAARESLWALLPIAIGHLISIAVVVALVGGLRMASFNADWVRYGGAAALIAFGVFRLLWPRAHPRWVAMRVNWRSWRCGRS